MKKIGLAVIGIMFSSLYTHAENLPEWQNIPKLDLKMYVGNDGEFHQPHSTGELLVIMSPCNNDQVTVLVSEQDSSRADDYMEQLGFNLNFATRWQNYETATLGGLSRPVYAEFKIPQKKKEQCE